MEIWKDIEGYEGLYQVSNEGRVKSLGRIVVDVTKNKKRVRHFNEKILKHGKNTAGRMFVQLCKNGVIEKVQVHRLVAQSFIPNPHNYDVVHHKDHNHHNNCIENLMWISDKQHRELHCHDGAEAAAETCSKIVYQYTLEGEFVRTWKSTMECDRNGFNQSAVASCCRGERKQYKGFRWSYKELC
jgi:hypothetical protein